MENSTKSELQATHISPGTLTMMLSISTIEIHATTHYHTHSHISVYDIQKDIQFDDVTGHPQTLWKQILELSCADRVNSEVNTKHTITRGLACLRCELNYSFL